MQLTMELRQEYQQLFDSCVLSETELDTVLRETEPIILQIERHKHRYQAVGGPLGIPWYVVAVIHHMESGLRFDGHLHNGDPLAGRTVHKPKGYPRAGTPPFTWEASAMDALKLEDLHQWNDWSVPGTLYILERYNGWGYRLYHPEILSPYLWSGSNHYLRGRYEIDGTWSSRGLARRYGAAVLLRRMCETKIIQFCSRTSFF